MATAGKAGQGGGNWISANEIAGDLAISTDTLARWVAAGNFPAPVVRIGQTRRWRRADYEQFQATGRWPAPVAARR